MPTLDQMTKIDKEVEIKKSITKKNRATIERKDPIRIEDREESSSSSFVNILDSDQEYLDVPTHQSPTLIEYPPTKNLEEVHSSPVTKKIPSKRHSIIHEEENTSSYNIEQIFEAFTFNLYKKEVSRKRV
jgi:hypothetical protein